MNKTPKPAITEFSQETVEAIDNYVYALIDPRERATNPRRIFYVGKGKGQRCFAHAAAAVKWKPKDEPNPRIERIRQIRKATGAPPPIQIIAHKLSEDEAYRLEAALISVLRTDTNFVSGQHGSDYNLAVEKIEGRYSKPLRESAIKHRVLLVSLNGAMSWSPEFRPRVKMDFCRSAVDKKEQTYESKTQTTQWGLQGQSGIRGPGGA